MATYTAKIWTVALINAKNEKEAREKAMRPIKQDKDGYCFVCNLTKFKEGSPRKGGQEKGGGK